MKIAKFWARESASAEDGSGYRYRLVSWSGSNTSLEQAKKNALSKLNKWLDRLRRGERLQEYAYVDRDEIKEELIEELHDDKGNLIAAITRNRYGALVLNSAHVLFADVDLPEEQYSGTSFIQRLLSLVGLNKTKSTVASLGPRDLFRQKFVDFQKNNSHLSLRVYETAAGFRLIVMNEMFDPVSGATEALLEELNSDKLYIRLCRNQACFRARLTPKPWRCDSYRPSVSFPYETLEKERQFSAWLAQYEKASNDYSVCNLVDELGSASTEKTIDLVVQLHDSYVLAVGNRSLA